MLTNLEALANALATKRYTNVLVLSGAGMSAAAGIPDFRSPGGLYDSIGRRFGISDPMQAFDIARFRKEPELFYAVARLLFGDRQAVAHPQPTRAHHFVRLLSDRGQLLRHYTQNIDMLDDQAGLPSDQLVEVHGALRTARCTGCAAPAAMADVWPYLRSGAVFECEYCEAPVKPDIVFFGEELPERFEQTLKNDLALCDLAIVIGTSLQVQPFASVVNMLPAQVPRVLINRERTRQIFDLELLGDIDEIVAELRDLGQF